jgi:hypothetical protein
MNENKIILKHEFHHSYNLVISMQWITWMNFDNMDVIDITRVIK